MLFGREIWRTLGFWTRKAVECDNLGLKGHPSRILEDSLCGSSVGCGDPGQEVSEGNRISNSYIERPFLLCFAQKCDSFLPLS